MNDKVLKKIQEKKLTPAEGYDALYGNPANRGRFIIIRLYVCNHSILNFLVALLFFFPWPLWLVKIILKFIKFKGFQEYKDLALSVISSARGFQAHIFSYKAIVQVKII